MVTLSNIVNTVIWFPEQERGVANGLITLGMALGFFIGSIFSAAILSPALNGWQNVFFLYGAVAILFGLIWMSTRASPNEALLQGHGSNSISFQQGLSHILKLGSLWFLGFGILGISGSVQGVLGYLPFYLQDLGWSAARSGILLATFHISSMLFVIPLTFLADKTGSKRTILLAAAAITVIGFGLLAFLNGEVLWASTIMAGMVRDGFMAIFFIVVIEVKGVGSAYSSLATGLMMIFMGVGNLFAPPLGNSLSTVGTAETPLVFWACLAAIGTVCLVLAFRQRVQRREYAGPPRHADG
jgi:cyanate permease